MKKIFSVLLSIILILTMLVGCSSKKYETVEQYKVRVDKVEKEIVTYVEDLVKNCDFTEEVPIPEEIIDGKYKDTLKNLHEEIENAPINDKKYEKHKVDWEEKLNILNAMELDLGSKLIEITVKDYFADVKNNLESLFNFG